MPNQHMQLEHFEQPFLRKKMVNNRDYTQRVSYEMETCISRNSLQRRVLPWVFLCC